MTIHSLKCKFGFLGYGAVQGFVHITFNTRKFLVFKSIDFTRLEV